MEKKKNINVDIFIRNTLIILTIISFIIIVLVETNVTYSTSYDTTRLNELLVSASFNWILWIDNILVFIFGILYIVSAIQSKKEMLLKIVFSIFCMLSTIVVLTFAINFVATVFGIF